jgi:hypothetical protein
VVSGKDDPCNLGVYSRGGGLIWFSADMLLFHSGSELHADGNKGKILTESGNNAVSGGGAGGQILIWAHVLSIPELSEGESAPTFTANGGYAMCSNAVAGGAGGGGFVGVGLLKDRSLSSVDDLTVKVSSGEISDECRKDKFPEDGEEMALGSEGIKASLTPCIAGHSGLTCDACRIGTWNNNGGPVCKDCNDIPANAAFTRSGISYPDCPYKCVNGVPSVFGNPECLTVPQFILHFFGGYRGLLIILCCLVLVVVWLLWRRNRKRGLVLRTSLSTSFDNSGMTSGDGTNMLQFTKDKLPYHICRVFMNGTNSSSNPWLLDEHVPDALQSIILSEPWGRYVSEMVQLTAVPRHQRLWEKFLNIFYPPAAPLYSLSCRRKRVLALRQCTFSFSEGSEALRPSVWKSYKQGLSMTPSFRPSCSGVYGMAFGCDQGATLGYIDFFDFERSKLDYAPIDLRQEVRICIAHGNGTYAEPFAVDPADPLLQHLGEMGFGDNAAGCKERFFSVVASFNWNASHIGRKDLEDAVTSGYSLALESLREHVEACASRNNLSGFVQVLVAPQSKIAVKSLRQRLSQASGVETSFSDLVPPGLGPPIVPGGRQMSPGAQSDITMSVLDATYLPGPLPKGTEMKLCLAFVDSAARHFRSGSDGACSVDSVTGLTPVFFGKTITSPMLPHVFREHLDCRQELPPMEETPRLPCLSGCARRVSSWALASRFSSHRRQWFANQAVLVTLIAVYGMDLMMFVMSATWLWQYNFGVFFLWLLVPPLSQPLAILWGPYTVITENPRYGRMFILLVFFGVTNAVITMLALLLSNSDSWIFHILECLTVIFIKAILMLLANANITSLESAYDLSFVGAQQDDAVNVLLDADGYGSSGAPRRMRSTEDASSIAGDQTRGSRPVPLSFEPSPDLASHIERANSFEWEETTTFEQGSQAGGGSGRHFGNDVDKDRRSPPEARQRNSSTDMRHQGTFTPLSQQDGACPF